MTSLLPPMSKKELDRFDILSRLRRKEINGTDAARLLGVCVRQVRLSVGVKGRRKAP